MTSIDERIKEELSQENDILDELLPDMAMQVFKGKLKYAVMLMTITVTILFCLTIWCISEFVSAESLIETVRWGVWSILSALLTITLELWGWMQINRVATRGENKELELNICRMLDRMTD